MSAVAARDGWGARLGGMTLPLGILAVVAMMVLPLPVALLDLFFVGNILLSLVILMVALHTFRPLDFSSFPSILLVATVLRLALNVASTRIVLSHGHTGHDAAGKVIEAFGSFVIGGNFVVGAFVFAILVIINLVVITKGAGRVSEVSARFTLDAMPGKQMAIDADLNAGLLNPDEARERRADVAAEADFYGAMDGASKFVKGDAMAGILILIINIVGGIIIGTLQHGLGVMQAAETYVLLSIGDGLVAQIPSLLLSIATAIIVTRVSSTTDMSVLIGKQMGIGRAWVPVAAVMLILGLTPGMPNLLFLLGGVAAAAMAWVAFAREGAGAKGTAAAGGAQPAVEAGAAPGPEAITTEDVTDYAPISLQIGYGLIPLAGDNGGALVARITAIRRDVSKALGFVVPGVRIRDDLGLAPNQYRIRVGQAILAEDTVYPDRKLALPGGASRRKLNGIAVRDPSFGLEASWILPHQVAEAEADDHVVVEPESVIATHLSQILVKHAAQLIGQDDVQGLVDALGRTAPTLVQSVVPKLVPLHVLTAVLKALLADRIPVSDMRRILEGLSDLAGRSLQPVEMAEALRPALVPLLLQQMGPISQPLPLITLEPDLEQLLLRSRRQGDEMLLVDNGLAQSLLTALSERLETASGQGKQAAVIVAQPLRRAFAAFVRPHLPDAVVIGMGELPEARRVEVLGTVGGAPALPPGAAR
ncbi:Flagellar biosynthesis protein FlhA [Cereibacter sphaeroides WS8N]|uniref:flagellar biosynthesis protein FlhA n=1 Tax=Cereibacter sphaeroides TaxID=1063 RepID=UPI00020DF9DB|nr:flagellar biosynthesis protein FlhA [Cereibacter sphaeroides]AZB63587.1 flagellar biosynthesis protein FlhA [Cereibacter sphaeroides]AZB68494.1 flagellar biosynthesis protein FlhA [Cereibacter sphaeroides]EGJ21483.1 Flagellar biosynthesis protein FlhA [Cereibacter sphaeroides WS8N]MWP38257.1 flagellar biosynthesis protein FlhA [Cereibacter sphaeroides]